MTLYESKIDRVVTSIDENERIQGAYENMLMNEGKEEAAAIREVLKNKFKLTNRDVSVKARHGGTSSSVTVSLKSTKALPFMKKIEEIGRGKESYQRDQATGSILAGGNTFIFVELDYKFRGILVKKIEAEINKNITDEFMNGEGGGNSIKIYGDYQVVKDRQKKDDQFYVLHSKSHSVGSNVFSIIEAAARLLYLMLKNEDVKNLKKLK